MKRILPKYSIIPVVSLLIMGWFAYYGTRPISTGMFHHNLTLPLDSIIPYSAVWIVPYVLTYVFWFLCYYAVMLDSKQLCYRVFSAELMGKAVCALCYVLLPCTLIQATPGDGFFDNIVKFIYASDRPDNLLPSIHVYDSWLFCRGLLMCKRVPVPVKVCAAIFTLMICASTVLVKQHVVLDIAAGILLAEASLLVAKFARTGRLFEKTEPKWVKE